MTIKVNRSAEVQVAKATKERLATLEVQAIDRISRGRKANIELGRIFNEMKSLLPHGGWRTYFKEKIKPHGIALRTATDYMRMAVEAEALFKRADSALFPQATDAQAKAIRNETDRARAKVAQAAAQQGETANAGIAQTGARGKRPRHDGYYNFRLYLSGDEKDATDELQRSRHWASAERRLIRTLRKLFVKYHISSMSKNAKRQHHIRSRKRG